MSTQPLSGARVLLVVLALLAFSSVAIADNSVTVGCPHSIDSPGAETFINIPVYFTNDVDLGGFTLGFNYNSSDIEIDSMHIDGTVVGAVGQNFFQQTYDPANNRLLIGWADFSFVNPIPAQTGGLIFTLVARVPAGAASQCVDIDSTFYPPAGDFIFSPQTGGQLTPDYIDCGTDEIEIDGGCGAEPVPPVAVCAAVVVDADENCAADASIDDGSYDPEGQDISLTQVPAGPYALGVTTVKLIVTDTDELADTCETTVTVVDNTDPVVSCPANITVDNDAGECGAVVGFSVTAEDNCPSVTVASNPASGSLFPIGTTTVEAIATDAAGNKDTCYFDVTVNDTEFPVANCPGDVTVDNDADQCGAVVAFSVGATDNCPGVGAVANPASGSLFSIGTTAVEVIATDASGNKDTCYFDVTVNDAQDPVAVCPGDQTVDNDAGECGAVVNFAVSASDNCPGAAVVADPASGTMFDIGITTVEVVATDAVGNKDTCYFDVTVVDAEAPVAICHSDTTVLVETGVENAVVEFSSSATDNCPGVSVSCTPPSGSTFPLGITTVSCIAVDAAGNEDTCTFDINVTQELNPDFGITADPDTLFAIEGIPTSLSYDVDVSSIDGFVEPVLLDVTPLPTDVTLDFSVNPVTPPGSSVLSGSTAETTPAGTYAMTISGAVPAKEALAHDYIVYLVVEPCTEPPVVGLSETLFEYTITVGEDAPDPEVYITNEASCGTLSWGAFADVGWATPDPTSGAVDAGETPGDLMTIMTNTTGLEVGDHSANITVSADKAVAVDVTVLVHVEAAPESEDTVYVSDETGYPGMPVEVGVTFKNDEELSGMSLGLMWETTDLYLDSVSYIGSRVDYVASKITTINNGNRTAGLGVLVIPPELQVPVGSGLWATLHFTVNGGAAPGTVVGIDTTFIAPGVELIFNDSLANVIYPQFVAGSVTIDEVVGPGLEGYVKDESGVGIPGAGVELYDMFPDDGPVATTMSGPDGYFSFDMADKSGDDYFVRAYKAGYYPGMTDTPFPNDDILVVLAASGGTVTPTHEWVDLYCELALFDEMPLPLGTVIEAYDPMGNLCGQWDVTEVGRYGFMPVYVDDPWSVEDEGCEVGDLITLLVNGFEVTPFNDPLIWTGNGDRYETCFEGRSIIEVCIPLYPGWNLISWNVDTEFDDIELLATDVMDNVDVILSFESGGMTYDPLLPEFSTLTDVDHFHGAWFRMLDHDTLCVEGLYVDPSTPIALEENWNLVSYLPDETLLIEDALTSIWSYIVVVLGYDGGGLTYDMAHPELATLTELSPTFGYWIKTDQACSLVYPDGTPIFNSAPPDATYSKESHVPRVVTSNTWINLYGSSVMVDSRPLQAGTVIQAFNENDFLVGEFVVSHQGRFGFMPVYGVDSYSENAVGATPGESIRFTINGIEAEERVDWTANGDRVKIDHFSLNATAAGDDSVLPRDYSLDQNYPNPFNPETQIDYYLAEAGMVELSIYNVLGTKIKTLVSEYQAQGSYTVKWYGDSDTGEQVATGVYFYKLSAGEFSETKKMLLLK